MLIPDEDMQVSFEDLDSASAGRDVSGVMHRMLVRSQVGKWNFVYSHLNREEYAYMESLFQGKDHFQFTYPSLTNAGETVTVTAYRSALSFGWIHAKTGQMRNYKFAIIEC